MASQQEIGLKQVQDALATLRLSGRSSVASFELLATCLPGRGDAPRAEMLTTLDQLLERHQSLLGISRIRAVTVVDDGHGEPLTCSSWAIWHED